jgi:hypothetical protein
MPGGPRGGIEEISGEGPQAGERRPDQIQATAGLTRCAVFIAS